MIRISDIKIKKMESMSKHGFHFFDRVFIKIRFIGLRIV